MRRSALLLITIGALVSLAALPGHAAQSATYVTINNSVVAGQISGCVSLATPPAPPVPRTCPAGNVGFGGFGFAATSTVPASVKVADASGAGVGFTACQDLNANVICGEGGEPRFSACSRSTAYPLSGFKANYGVTVFVYALSTDCDGTGTTGTITIT